MAPRESGNKIKISISNNKKSNPTTKKRIFNVYPWVTSSILKPQLNALLKLTERVLLKTKVTAQTTKAVRHRKKIIISISQLNVLMRKTYLMTSR